MKVYLSKLFQKVGAKDRLELALFGLKNMMNERDCMSGLPADEIAEEPRHRSPAGLATLVLRTAAPVRRARMECDLPAEIAGDPVRLANLLDGLSEIAALDVQLRPDADNPHLSLVLTTQKRDDELQELINRNVTLGGRQMNVPAPAAPAAPAAQPTKK